MAGLIEKLLNKGRDPEEDKRIKAEADAAAERYAQQTGTEPPEEAGLIESDPFPSPEENRRIKREADAAAYRYAQRTGTEPPEEPGIIETNPLPSPEDESYYMDLKDPKTGEMRRERALMGMPPPPSLLGGLKSKGMPAAKPRFDEVGGPNSGQNFATFIRKEEPKAVKAVAKAPKPDTDQWTMRKAIEPSYQSNIQDLQLEMQLEAAKGTPEGYKRARELQLQIRQLQGNK